MKHIISSLLAGGVLLTLSGCMQDFEPQTSYVTANQASQSQFANLASTVTAKQSGYFAYNSSSTDPYDFGITSFFIQRDVMGNDLIPEYTGSWFSTWYTGAQALAPTYARCQVPWTVYYNWIKNCNIVITTCGDEPTAVQRPSAGMARFYRAYYYFEMAQMFGLETYTQNPQAITVPIIKPDTDVAQAMNNPRATNEEIFNFILADLDKAEEYLEGFTPTEINQPDLSCVYGEKARVYLVKGDWANAEKYAKLAQEGHTMMSTEEYLSRENGFNSPNSSWMLGVQFKKDDPNITQNDADSSWGSAMILEMNGSECGYASCYGQPIVIDRHLYETMPATDIRKQCFVDFTIDDLATKEDKVKALEAYSDYPDWVYATGYDTEFEKVGGLSLKFRATGGVTGHYNQYIGFLVAVPLMRVEEMMLIEAEAAGMQNEGRGIQLLTDFAMRRDPSFVYGKHNEAYGNPSTPAFQNEVWWQRRVELWGEGMATFDIKRLNKGIIRSYPGTNHLEGKRWNFGIYTNQVATNNFPSWMNLCIVQTESNYNTALVNTPYIASPSSDSPEFIF